MRMPMITLVMLMATGCNGDQSSESSDLGLKTTPVESVVTGSSIPNDIRQSLLQEREGWGARATGGENSFVVTSLNDSGPGTLREALKVPGRWIIFAQSGTISLESPLWVPPRTTIDGRHKSIHIETAAAGNFTAALFVHGVNNVIITNLNLDNARISGSNWNTDSEGHDAIEVRNSTDLWFHRNTFAHWADGAIDIRYSDNSQSGLQMPWGGTGLPRTLPERISITHNKFHNIFQALSLTGDRISFGHNYCSNIKRRCVKAIYGRTYSYNNLIESWADKSIQDAKDLPSGINPPGKDQYGNFVGNPAERFGKPNAELLSEQNVFEAKNKEDSSSSINKSSNGKISCKNNHGEVEFVETDDSINTSIFSELAKGDFAVRKIECRLNDKDCVTKKIKEQSKSAGASTGTSPIVATDNSTQSKVVPIATAQEASPIPVNHSSPIASSVAASSSSPVASAPVAPSAPITPSSPVAPSAPVASSAPVAQQPHVQQPVVAEAVQCPWFPRSPVSGDTKSCGDACKKQLRAAAAAIGYSSLPGTGLDKYEIAKDVYKKIRSFGQSTGCDPLRETQF